jgi:hypothetical protein
MIGAVYLKHSDIVNFAMLQNTAILLLDKKKLPHIAVYTPRPL